MLLRSSTIYRWKWVIQYVRSKLDISHVSGILQNATDSIPWSCSILTLQVDVRIRMLSGTIGLWETYQVIYPSFSSVLTSKVFCFTCDRVCRRQRCKRRHHLRLHTPVSSDELWNPPDCFPDLGTTEQDLFHRTEAVLY